MSVSPQKTKRTKIDASQGHNYLNRAHTDMKIEDNHSHFNPYSNEDKLEDTINDREITYDINFFRNPDRYKFKEIGEKSRYDHPVLKDIKPNKTPQVHNLMFPNPLLGESEGEIKSKRLKDNFAKYLKESMDHHYRQKRVDMYRNKQKIQKDKEFYQNLRNKHNQTIDTSTPNKIGDLSKIKFYSKPFLKCNFSL